MVFEHIDKLKQEYTDRYVVVSDEHPELRRFKGLTGTVRTVNMSGRALVEFDAYNNIGWYDIDVDYLEIVDQPLAKPEPEKKKPAAKPKAAPAAKKKAPPKSEEKKPAQTGGMSVQDVLAAARGGAAPAAKAAEPAAPPKKDAKSMSIDDVLAAARGQEPAGGSTAAAPESTDDDTRKSNVRDQLQAARKAKGEQASAAPAASSSAKVDPKKMSVEEMLAHARGEVQGGTPAAEPPPAETAPQETPSTDAPAEEAAGQEAAEEAAEPPAASEAGGSGPRKDLTSVEDIVAYCRQVDG